MLAGTRRRQQSCMALAPSAKAAKSRFLPLSAECRELISEAEGDRPVKKSVWYIGNLRQDVDETKLGDFVERRANELDAKITLFKATVFKKKKDGALAESWSMPHPLPSWATNLSGRIPRMCALGNSELRLASTMISYRAGVLD